VDPSWSGRFYALGECLDSLRIDTLKQLPSLDPSNYDIDKLIAPNAKIRGY